MPLILRVDVDKPYGRKNLCRRVASKLVEDYWFPPALYSSKYLTHLVKFLEFCNRNEIAGCIYFRACTRPDEKITRLLKEGNHKIGFHAENTRSFETFSAELNAFKRHVTPLKVDSFTKHGSGELKLGRHHYPSYEPDKYKEWANKLEITYKFGNGICKQKEDLYARDKFFPDMFWMEREYRDAGFSGLPKLIEAAKEEDVAVLIHPCGFETSQVVADDFNDLIKLSRKQGVTWKV